uniref:Protein FAM111A-like n=1 Tax=Stegastes partitus TaxID=144197 RepID=A0A3B5A8A5_9TELE
MVYTGACKLLFTTILGSVLDKGGQLTVISHSKLQLSRHSHHFKVKFPNDKFRYTIDCDQPHTVLDAIKLHLNEQFTKMEKRKNYSDEKIIIQLSDVVKQSIVATHFPCSCIQNDECLIVHFKNQEVEEPRSQDDEILPREQYSVFYISKEGGEKAKKTTLFKNKTVKEFDYLCVYAKKGTTVKEALERDGRFVDFQDFKLSEDENSKEHTLCTQKVDKLDQKKFKICLPKNTTTKANCSKEQSQQKLNTRSVLEKAKKSRISVGRAMEESGSTEQLKLKKENFGKIEQSFSEVQRLVNLSQLGKSVCLLKINAFHVKEQGTGFVLFDNLILTNAHLFKACADLLRDERRDHVKITAEFNYEKPDCEPHKKEFKAKLLGKTGEANVEFGPPPANGEACLIGHPAGEVKKIDPTCIIEIDNRGQAVGQQLHPYKDKLFVVQSVVEALKQQGIESTLEGGCKADKVVTDNTFMYHGSSGSPVFDVGCRVFGLHTAGYCYGFPEISEKKQSVIEFAQPVLTIFESFATPGRWWSS